MSNLAIFNSAARLINRATFGLKKRSPEILIVAGVTGVVASTVMACKATLKVDEVLDDAKKSVDKIHTALEKGVTEAEKKYTKDDSVNDLKIVYIQTGVKLVKLYAPSVIVGLLSLTAIVTSNNIMRKRNIELMTAYTTLSKCFGEYRDRVVERFGEETEREIRHNIQKREIEETVVNEDGSESVVTNTVDVINGPTESNPYSIFFDQTCLGFTKDPHRNKTYLLQQERFANELLRTRHHLFVNEVYDMLGIDRIPMGWKMGWIFDEVHPHGDNEVKFNIFNGYREANRRFVNGLEPVVLIDLNVDKEPIVDLI